MGKKYTYTSAIGECKYEFKDKIHHFTVTFGERGFMSYALGANGVLTTDGDIEDTCRGLMDIVTASLFDGSFLDKLSKFKGADAFLPTFIGNYHTNLLENTPVTKKQVESLKKIFTTDGFKFFKDIISMFIDCGPCVAIAPVNAALNKS